MSNSRKNQMTGAIKSKICMGVILLCLSLRLVQHGTNLSSASLVPGLMDILHAAEVAAGVRR